LTRAKAGVAVVDLDKVAQELGRDTQMKGELIGQQNSLAKDLGAIQKNFEGQLAKMKEELGEEPAPEKLQEFSKAKQVAQFMSKITTRRDQLIGEFRTEARPVAEKIAKSVGATAVMTRNDAVIFSYDNTIDITDQVIAEMKANPTKPAAKPAAAPKSDSNVRQASATTTKPAAKPAAAPAAKAAPAKKAE
jgi:Skp family chaperone for outer membrane proteins